MFKFRFFSLVIISLMLILGLSASSVLADGVKVSDDNVGCEDPIKETNILVASDSILIWWNTPGVVPAGGDLLDVDIFPPGNSKIGPCSFTDDLDFTQCAAPDDNYWWAPYTTCSVAFGFGVFNLTLSDDGALIGQDSWRREKP